MSNQIIPFDFEGSKVRTVSINDEAWFVGVDVAKVLGYTNKTKAVINHVEEDDLKQTKIPQSQNGTLVSKVNLINISGVFSLILSSKLPSAKKFRHWVTDEVLPEIGRTGSYRNKPLTATEQLKLATQSVDELDDRVTNLEETMEITSNDEFKLKRVGQNKALTVLGGKNSEAYKKIGRKVFSQMWRDFKNNFLIPRYSSLPKKQLDEGIAYLNNWQPDEVLVYAIQGLNRQEVNA